MVYCGQTWKNIDVLIGKAKHEIVPITTTVILNCMGLHFDENNYVTQVDYSHIKFTNYIERRIIQKTNEAQMSDIQLYHCII